MFLLFNAVKLVLVLRMQCLNRSTTWRLKKKTHTNDFQSSGASTLCGVMEQHGVLFENRTRRSVRGLPCSFYVCRICAICNFFLWICGLCRLQ